ncbi:hypothetical protein [Massilia phyllosphaerae]|uniref:hypothetical protein n=1 Tax=Massilia phyllosphaerae TaxID=3106034 RepID=UPI002B1CC7A4|nr:hypothetical protein [Massilia sp. SGZ-792]
MANEKSESFAHSLREVLSNDADKLFDFQLALMEREIDDGWRVFYAKEILFKEVLPAPLINEVGKLYAVEQLRCEIWRDLDQMAWRGFGQTGSNYRSTLLAHWSEHPETLKEYRNFLHVGSLDTSGAFTPDPLDHTANAVLRQRIETEHKHWMYELEAMMNDWYVEASAQGVLTPSLIGWDQAPAAPIRDMSKALVDDKQYWRTVHQERWSVAGNANEFKAFIKPDENLRLMAAMAPDFPYAAHLSTGKRLVFVQQGDGPLAWALMIDKTDGSTTYRYPPKLILIRRTQTKKLKDADILYMNVLGKSFVSHIDGARCLEMELLFHLPRSRRLIAFYAPFVQQALRHVSS